VFDCSSLSATNASKETGRGQKSIIILIAPNSWSQQAHTSVGIPQTAPSARSRLTGHQILPSLWLATRPFTGKAMGCLMPTGHRLELNHEGDDVFIELCFRDACAVLPRRLSQGGKVALNRCCSIAEHFKHANAKRSVLSGIDALQPL
jgi:hypothetical protein